MDGKRVVELVGKDPSRDRVFRDLRDFRKHSLGGAGLRDALSSAGGSFERPDSRTPRGRQTDLRERASKVREEDPSGRGGLEEDEWTLEIRGVGREGPRDGAG